MNAATAVSFSRIANNFLADAIERHPAAAKEIERGVTQLGMHAVVINSHAQGEYVSDPKLWDIFVAAEAFDAPIYLHRNALPPAMLRPFQACGLDGAIYGFGVFDRCPKLRMIIGHMGEALVFCTRTVYPDDSAALTRCCEALAQLIPAALGTWPPETCWVGKVRPLAAAALETAPLAAPRPADPGA